MCGAAEALNVNRISIRRCVCGWVRVRRRHLALGLRWPRKSLSAFTFRAALSRCLRPAPRAGFRHFLRVSSASIRPFLLL